MARRSPIFTLASLLALGGGGFALYHLCHPPPHVVSIGWDVIMGDLIGLVIAVPSMFALSLVALLRGERYWPLACVPLLASVIAAGAWYFSLF